MAGRGEGLYAFHALSEARAGGLATAGAAGFPASSALSNSRLDRSPAPREARLLLALAYGSSRYRRVVSGVEPWPGWETGTKEQIIHAARVPGAPTRAHLLPWLQLVWDASRVTPSRSPTSSPPAQGRGEKEGVLPTPVSLRKA